VGCWYRCHIGWIEASGKFGVIQASSPTMKNSKVVRIRRSDHASVSSHRLSDPVPSGRAVIRNIEVFSSAKDAAVPITETEGKYYEVSEAMEMSGSISMFVVGCPCCRGPRKPIFILVSIFWKFVVEV
jgi:hypothetical protein